MRISDWSSDVCSSDLNARAKKWLALSDARGIRKHGEFILSGRKTVPEALARYGGRFTAALARSESDLNRLAQPPRSEGRRVGPTCVRPSRYRWSPYR